jgi:hypothetical protein
MKTAPHVLLVLVAALLGCGGSVPTEVPFNPNRCGHDVQPSVSPGLTPTIAWTPACEIGAISIVRLYTDSIGSEFSEQIWAIETADESDPLGPPVTYGVAPHGFSTVWPAKPLVAGELYNVTLEVHSRERVGPVVSVGFDPVARLDFRP